MARHEECMRDDKEYNRTYRVMLEHNLSLEKIIEVVVKSNRIIGVGVVSLKDGIDAQLKELMRGY